jgi:hypothetical protein
VRDDDPDDQPPAYALPLAEALRELSGDWWLDRFARMVESAAITRPRSWAGILQRINARRAEKTLARLRGDELVSWGEPGGEPGPVRLSGRLWQRLEVLDAELGVVAQVLPNGERLRVFREVVVVERWWGAPVKSRGRPRPRKTRGRWRRWTGYSRPIRRYRFVTAAVLPSSLSTTAGFTTRAWIARA